jgi:hypothetical protein
MLPRIVMAVFLVSLSALSAFPCSIPTFGLSRFDMSQYVFVGEVTGYVETTELINKRQTPSEVERYGELANKTFGIVVRVVQAFHTPTESLQEYEVYRFSLSGSCGLYGMSLEQVKEWYKVGDLIKVSAAKSEHVAQPKNPLIQRLEIRYGKADLISPIGNDDPLLRDTSSEFDYKAYRSDFLGDPYLEMLKDLRRLRLSDHKGRREILDRLTYFPNSRDSGRFFLEDIYKAYSADSNEFARYSELVREREMTKTEYNRFKEARTVTNP